VAPTLLRAAHHPSQRAELNERAEAVSAALTRERLSNTVDTTGTTVGKRWGAAAHEPRCSTLVAWLHRCLPLAFPLF
jgi:hypothetical protein